MNYTELIGFIAAILTTAAFLPQVYKTWKTKDVSGLSLFMLIVFFGGVTGWLVYGVLIHSSPMKIANGITLICILLLVYFKIRYDKKVKN